MPKKKKEEEVVAVEAKLTTLEGMNFKREDLNLLLDKVNEIIEFINK